MDGHGSDAYRLWTEYPDATNLWISHWSGAVIVDGDGTLVCSPVVNTSDDELRDAVRRLGGAASS